MSSDSVKLAGSSKVSPTVAVRAPHTFLEFPEAVLQESVASRFEAMAKRFADSDALHEIGHTITYRELNAAANRLACRIIELRGNVRGQVALLMESGLPMIVGVLATLKAGKTAVPIDAGYPLARQAFVIKNSQAELIVCTRASYSHCRELDVDPSRILNTDELPADSSTENPPSLAMSNEPCLLLYTSGSTGEPKGIVQTHRNVLHTCRSYTNKLRIAPEDRISHLHSTSFSAGITEVFWAILNGGTACVWDVRAMGFSGLREWISRQRISVLHWVPTIFRQLLQSALPGREYSDSEFRDVRVVMLGSEVVTRRDVDIWRKQFPEDSRFVCRLGSTEASNYRMLVVDRETELPGSVVPVGYPFGEKEILILDESARPLGPDQVGEIAIRSEYLSPGYWNRPELNEISFLPDPDGGQKRIFRSGDLGVVRADGLLEFLGRKDSQLKIHGQRIEASEIESALLEADGVKQAAVVCRVDDQGENYLVAYYVPHAGRTPSNNLLKHAMAKKLPAIMIPSTFVPLERLPLTTTGKLDRRALPAPHAIEHCQQAGSANGATTLEEITRIVESIVTTKALTPEMNLLNLGATSIDMIRILNGLERRFQFRPPIDEFYRKPTITALSVLIAAGTPHRSGQGLIDGSTPSRDSQHVNSTARALWFTAAPRTPETGTDEPAIEYEEGAI